MKVVSILLALMICVASVFAQSSDAFYRRYGNPPPASLPNVPPLRLGSYSYPVVGVTWESSRYVPSYKLFNGDTGSELEIKTLSETTQRLVSMVKSNEFFVKFSDGSVASVGKLVYEKIGLFPQSTNKSISIIMFQYKVLDVTDDGCRIEKDDDARTDDRDRFVVGLSGYSGRSYSGSNLIPVRRIGSYTYKTVSGASRTIPKFEVGEAITKEEYLTAIKK